jgi:hypothetical protein
MVIILFLLLVAVWAAVLLPSAMNAKRKPRLMSTTTPPQPPAERTRVSGSADTRNRVLARRRYALIALGAGALLTLIGAVVTGSFVLLIATLVFDVLLAVYITILLQVKQRSGHGPSSRRSDETGQETPVRAVGG